MSATAFATPTPFVVTPRRPLRTFNLPRGSRRPHTPHRPARATLQANAPSTKLPPPASFPACVPPAASEIECDYAVEMLRRLQYTPVQTVLSQPVIATAHVTSPGVSPAEDARAVPLVFMHGFDSNNLEYRYMLPLLDDEPTVDAYFLDVLGWGLTEKPRGDAFSYGPEAKREHLRAYLDHVVGDRQVVLVGASVGGAVAIDFALHYPQRVSGLALLAPQAFTDKPASPLMQRFPILASWGADVLRSDWLRNQAVQLAYESEALKCRDTLRIGGLHCKSDGWKEAAINFIIGEGYCLSDKVQHLDCPTLVLWGENDRVLPKGDSQKCLDTIHNCKLEIVKDSGHSPHIEKPSQVLRHIMDFLHGPYGII